MGKARILVVDDQPEIIQLLVLMLRQEYDVIVARDGSEALDTFKRETPDLVLLDLNMPRIPGWEVCRQIKADSATPVVIMTGHCPTEIKAAQVAADADAYILKPFGVVELLEQLHALAPAA